MRNIQAIDNLSSEEKRALLAQLLNTTANKPKSSVLSFAQQRLWFLEQLMPGSPFYNLMAALRLEGQLDLLAVKRAFRAIIRRHEMLRTTFHVLGGNPVQLIAATLRLPLPILDLRHLPRARAETEIRRLADEAVQRHFDLACGPLLSPTLLRIDDETEHILLLSMHHIITDGWSLGIFFQELTVFYNAYASGTLPALPELPIQYADYAIWQREWLQGDVLHAQLSYWRQQLAGAPQVLDMPMDHARPPVQTFRGAAKTQTLSRSLTEQLKALSRSTGATLFMTLLAAWQVLLYRYSGQEDIVVGSPIAGRNRRELEGLIGCFVNTLVLRTDLSGDPSFSEVLQRVREVCLRAYAYQDLPFERLVEELQPERVLSHHPLFQVTFSLEADLIKTFELSELRLVPISVESSTAKFDLGLLVQEHKQELVGTIEYSTDLFDSAAISRLLEHYRTILTGIVADPRQRIAQLPLLTAAERQQLLDDRTISIPDVCIQELFAQQAARTPDAVALMCEGQRLSYRELQRRVNQVAHALRRHGVHPQMRVGLCVNRSLDMVVGLLGILSAGAVYVPLDPDYPADRLAFILDDAQVALMLTQNPLRTWLPAGAHAVLALDTDWPAIATEPSEHVTSQAAPENLAYVIYTSGSTGRPKGVMVTHRNLVNTIVVSQETFGFRASDVMPCIASFAFDISLFELLIPLVSGGTSIVLTKRQVLELSTLARQLDDITALHMLPSLMHQLISYLAKQQPHTSYKHIRAVFVGGDVVTSDLLADLRRTFRSAQIYVLYGPTEGTIICSCYFVPSAPIVHKHMIGSSLPNAVLRLYNKQHALVPIGVAGEIYIGGANVTRGYLGQPELTREKYVAIDNQPFYKTGDLARYCADGTLEFLGRIDAQVKIRGFRVEPGEIEAVLGQHPALCECAVIAGEEAAGERKLIAYVVLAEVTGEREQGIETARLPSGDEGRTTKDEDSDSSFVVRRSSFVQELRNHLRQTLPDYMLPSAFLFLDALPLSPNGKLDRRALPALTTARPELAAGFVAPREGMEQTIAAIWQEVLKIDLVGVCDNFFDLGGHSLLVLQVLDKLRDQLPHEISVVELFQYPTISLLAEHLTQEQAEPAPLQNAQLRAGTRREFMDRQRQRRHSSE